MRRVWLPRDALPFCIRVIRAIRGEFTSVQSLRLLLLAEFLESRIAAQRILPGLEIASKLFQLG